MKVDLVAVAQADVRVLEGVDARSVPAAQIRHAPLTGLPVQPRMTAGHGAVFDDQIAARVAADRDLLPVEREREPLAVDLVDELRRQRRLLRPVPCATRVRCRDYTARRGGVGRGRV